MCVCVSLAQIIAEKQILLSSERGRPAGGKEGVRRRL